MQPASFCLSVKGSCISSFYDRSTSASSRVAVKRETNETEILSGSGALHFIYEPQLRHLNHDTSGTRLQVPCNSLQQLANSGTSSHTHQIPCKLVNFLATLSSSTSTSIPNRPLYSHIVSTLFVFVKWPTTPRAP